jgi:hypothetical protein
MNSSVSKQSLFKHPIFNTAIASIQQSSGENRSSSVKDSILTAFERSNFDVNLFDNNSFSGEGEYVTSETYADKTATDAAWGSQGAHQAQDTNLINQLSKQQLNADPSSKDYKINPNTFNEIDPSQYYGHNGSGDGFDFERAKRFDIKDTELPTDSKLIGATGDLLQAKILWNDIRKNLIAGADGKGLFADDAHLNAALNEAIDNFNAGKNGENHDFQNAIKNNDVLSTVAAFRISKEGIHENGLGELYEAYAKVDNVLPDNIINAAYLSKYDSELRKNGGNVVAALEAIKSLDNKTYGMLDVDSDQVKSFANNVNKATFESMAKSLNLDPQALEKTLEKINGIYGENKFYNVSGPKALASALDTSLLETDENGKTGFQKLNEQSKPRADGKNHEAHVSFHLSPQGDENTDGTAFLDFSQNGIEALASLQKHVGGLTDNPLLANQFSFVFKDEKNFKEWAPKILEEMKKANIDVTKMVLNIEGHGSAESGAMMKSGVVGRNYQGIGQDDSQFLAKLLDHTPALRQVEVNYDSCYGYYPAEHNAQAIDKRAQELGLNIATSYEGSKQCGLVLAECGGEENQRDRFTANADGTLSALSQRVDDGGTDVSNVLFSQGKEKFEAEMQKSRDERYSSSESPEKLTEVS